MVYFFSFVELVWLISFKGIEMLPIITAREMVTQS
jgi:hypothetical protein